MLRLVKTTDKDNDYGFDIIDFIQFNYDGQGTALVKEKSKSGEWILGMYGKEDLDALFGFSEERPMCYRVEII